LTHTHTHTHTYTHTHTHTPTHTHTHTGGIGLSPLDSIADVLDEVYPPKNFAMVYQGTSKKKKPQNKNKKGENTL